MSLFALWVEPEQFECRGRFGELEQRSLEHEHEHRRRLMRSYK